MKLTFRLTHKITDSFTVRGTVSV